MRFFTNNKIARGFTLIELLITIAIIGLLASIIFVSLVQARTKARDSTRVSQLDEVSQALELYYNIYGSYPALVAPPTWDGNLCVNDPPCLQNSDQNWDNMISTLESAGVLAINQPPQTWQEQLAQFIFPTTAYASVDGHKIQDPNYPTDRYAYMTSAQPLNGDYRIRAQLENANSTVLQQSRTGNFYWTDKSSGVDACDTSLGYFCDGPSPDFGSFVPGKPVIYLYPTHTEQVAVDISDVTVDQSIPNYGTGWSVIAHPNGQLTNLSDGQSYPYLYWEGQSGKPTVDTTKGFVVASSDLTAFFQTSLSKLGLSASEEKDFIDYWVPRLQASGKPYVYIYYMPQADYDKLIPLNVSPKPDTTIRVYFLWKGIDNPITVAPETLSAPARNGFTLVEWGGDRSQIPDNFFLPSQGI